MFTFRHSINQSGLINQSQSANQIWSGDIAETLQEFKSCTWMDFICLIYVVNTFQTQMSNCAIKYLRVTNTIEAHSGISGGWQTTGVAQLTARLLSVKVFESRLSKCVGMYYANELRKHRHWCKVWHLFEAVTSYFDCGSRFWIGSKCLLLHGKNVFKLIDINCGIFAGEIYSNLDLLLVDRGQLTMWLQDNYVIIFSGNMRYNCKRNADVFHGDKVVSLPVCLLLSFKFETIIWF